MSATVDSGGRDPESLFRYLFPVQTGCGRRPTLVRAGRGRGGAPLDGTGEAVVVECRAKVGRDAAEVVVVGAARSDLVRPARVPLPGLPPAASRGLEDALPTGADGVVGAAGVPVEAPRAVG